MTANLAPFLFQEELYSVPPRVVVVLRQPWEQYTNDDKELLEKILINVKQSTAAVRIQSGEQFSPEELLPGTASSVLVFGSEVEGMVPYRVSAAQGLSMLVADDLPKLDQERKKRLWTGLREMFGV